MLNQVWAPSERGALCFGDVVHQLQAVLLDQSAGIKLPVLVQVTLKKEEP